MPQGDLKKTYKSNQFRHEAPTPNELMTVEFRPNDPSDLVDNPMRMWARTDTADLWYTVDGVNILNLSNGVALSKRIKLSKIKANGVTNDTAVLQSEMNNLQDGDIFITPPGISRLSRVTIGTGSNRKKNITFIFNATQFKYLDGLDLPTNGTMFAFEIENSVVYGFNTDGNVANIPDPTPRFGTMYNFSIGTFCNNVLFKNTKIYNTTYCGCLLGKRISNVVFDGLYAENIGEHVFYTGNGGTGPDNTDMKDVTFKNVRIVNLAMNQYNATYNHISGFVKLLAFGAGYGFMDNILVDGISIEYTATPQVGVSLVIIQNVENININNVVLKPGSFVYNASLIYPTERVYNFGVDTAYMPNLGLFVYTHVTPIVMGMWTARNINKTGITYAVNMFNLFQNCVLGDIYDEATFSGELDNRSETRFINCTIRSATTGSRLYFVETDYVFDSCQFISGATTPITTGMLTTGFSSYTSGKRLIFHSPTFISTNFTYTLRLYNTNTRLQINDSYIDGTVQSSAVGNAVTELILDNVQFSNTNNLIGHVTVTGQEVYNNVMNQTGRDMSRVRRTSVLASGTTSISYDPTGVIMRLPVIYEVIAIPQSNMKAAGVDSYWVTLSGNNVVINTNAAPSASLSFTLIIDVRTKFIS